jgi:hypothetical protein
VAGKDVNQAVQDLIVDAMRRSQEAVVDVVRSWRAQMSQWEGSSFSMPGDLPGVPGMPSLPPVVTPEQVDAAFDFAERMLADQRRFTKELLRGALPAVTSGSGPRPVDSGGKSSTKA